MDLKKEKIVAFELPNLAFDQGALMPHMSAKTLSFHHGKHHQGYVDKLNEAIEGTGFADLSLEQIIQETAGQGEHQDLFNNAAQHWNHSFFWRSLAPDGGGRPTGELARQIDRDFGSLDDFKETFVAAATGQFGSGWAWLVLNAGRLTVTATADADLPMVRGGHALLTCDLWEHAYYLDFQNRRGDFVQSFLDHLVNWDFAAERFDRQGEGNSAAARRFRKDQEDFAASGQVGAAARAARDALHGKESGELERARSETAARAVGEDPALRKGPQ